VRLTRPVAAACCSQDLETIIPASLLQSKNKKQVGENRLVRAVQITGKLFVQDLVEKGACGLASRCDLLQMQGLPCLPIDGQRES
jgi:hypothetical protein